MKNQSNKKVIILYGRIPSKKNSRILVCRGKVPISLPSSAYQSWHEEQSWMLKQFDIHEPIPLCEIEMVFFFPDKRVCDLSNKAESCMDLMVDNKILIDDSWKCVPRLILSSGGVDKENPRVEIYICEIS